MNAWVLYLTPKSSVVYRMNNDAWSEGHECANDLYARRALVQLVANDPALPVFVLVDRIEEEFLCETIPHVSFWERNDLLARHAHRHFRTTPYRFAKVIQRQPGGRRDDRVLISALTCVETINDWIGLLSEAGVAVSAINSVAHISEAVIAALGLCGRDVLLVSHDSLAGLRQSYFRNGSLCMSRLAPVGEERTGAQYDAQVQHEVDRTLRYLTTFNGEELRAEPEIVFLSDGPPPTSIDRRREGVRAWSVSEVARLLGLRGPAAVSTSLLWAHTLLRATNPNRYGSRPHFRLERKRKSLIILSRGLAWTCAATIALALHHSVLAYSVDITQQQLRHGAAVPLPDLTNVSPDATSLDNALALRDAVVAGEALLRLRHHPDAAFHALGGALARVPGLRLDRLEWSAALRTPEVSNPQSAEMPGAERYEAAVLSGRVVPFDDIRAAVQQVEQLAQSLRAQSSVTKVEIMTHPDGSASRGKQVDAGSVSEFVVRVEWAR